MKNKFKYKSSILPVSVIIIGFITVFLIHIQYISKLNKNTSIIDLKKIKKRGRLDIVIDYNSINYYLYKGQPFGFQYEMAQSFASFMKLDLNIIVKNDLCEAIDFLKKRKCDIVCSDLTIIKGRFGDEVIFTKPYAKTSVVLVKKKNKFSEATKGFKQLRGKTIYIPRNTIFKKIIKFHTRNLNEKPYIAEVPYYSSEYLINAVSEGIIDYTISDYNLARYYNSYYNDLDLSLQLTPGLMLGWALRTESVQFKNKLDSWLKMFLKTNEFKFLYFRYFKQKQPVRKQTSKYSSLNEGNISAYDETIKKYSKSIGWDWRLISALIYEESKFNHDTISRKGAIGIMQLMPGTLKLLGCDNFLDAESHIKAGLKYIKLIDKSFESTITDKEERAKFVIASYNLGPGHIWDAIKLSKKYKSNYKKWFNYVERFLLAKKLRIYFSDKVVKHGYCQGASTTRFVKKVMFRYYHYRNLIPED